MQQAIVTPAFKIRKDKNRTVLQRVMVPKLEGTSINTDVR